MPDTIPRLAAEEYHLRRDRARRKVAQRAIAAHDANALVLPWLALACRAGADLPEFADAIAFLRADTDFGFSESQARALTADGICPLHHARAALAAATAAALARLEAKPDADREHALRRLGALATHFHAWPETAATLAPAQSKAA
jgi:hypothetical protein